MSHIEPRGSGIDSYNVDVSMTNDCVACGYSWEQVTDVFVDDWGIGHYDVLCPSCDWTEADLQLILDHVRGYD